MASGGGWRVNRVSFGSVFVQHLPLLSSRHSLFGGAERAVLKGPKPCVCLQIPRIWLSSLMWGDRRSKHTKIGCKWMAEGEGCKSSVTWLQRHILLTFGLIYHTHKLVIWVYRSENSTGKCPGANVRCELISMWMVYYALKVSKQFEAKNCMTFLWLARACLYAMGLLKLKKKKMIYTFKMWIISYLWKWLELINF